MSKNVRRTAAAAVPLISSAFLVFAPSAAADTTDAQFIGEVSFYLSDRFLDAASTDALIADAKKVCAMSDAGFADESMQFIDSRWDPTDPFGFMLAATRAYCPQHFDRWTGL